MGNPGNIENSSTTAQAERFVARLYSGDMSARDEAELNDWLAGDPSHRSTYDRVLSLWDAAGDLTDDADIVEIGQRALIHRRSRQARRLAAVAAMLVLAVAIGLFIGRFPMEPNGVLAMETAIGEQQTTILDDGSSLTLNTASRVLVDFTATERRIVLDFGEIFLDVTKDANRPLTVLAGEHVVTVLGTQFSLQLAGDELKVAVVEGKVAVSDDDVRFPTQSPMASKLEARSVILEAGAVAELSGHKESVEQGNIGEVERLQSWRNGIVRFDKQTLINVVSEVNRYSKVKILIEDSSIADLPTSGILKLDHELNHVELLLSSFEDIHPIKVVRYPDRYVLVADDR